MPVEPVVHVRRTAPEVTGDRRPPTIFVSVEPDGCGYLKVNVKGVPTLAVGRELAAEAEKVGLM